MSKLHANTALDEKVDGEVVDSEAIRGRDQWKEKGRNATAVKLLTKFSCHLVGETGKLTFSSKGRV